MTLFLKEPFRYDTKLFSKLRRRGEDVLQLNRAYESNQFQEVLYTPYPLLRGFPVEEIEPRIDSNIQESMVQVCGLRKLQRVLGFSWDCPKCGYFRFLKQGGLLTVAI